MLLYDASPTTQKTSMVESNNGVSPISVKSTPVGAVHGKKQTVRQAQAQVKGEQGSLYELWGSMCNIPPAIRIRSSDRGVLCVRHHRSG